MYTQLTLWQPYEPEIGDYVIWERNSTGLDHHDEGWVYFKDEEYITIETGVKPRPECEYTNGKRLHRMIHTLLLCYAGQWHQLRFVKKRKPSKE